MRSLLACLTLAAMLLPACGESRPLATTWDPIVTEEGCRVRTDWQRTDLPAQIEYGTKRAGEVCGLEPKGGDLRECLPELYCDSGYPDHRVWDQGTCAPRIPVGQPCNFLQQCEGDARCLDDVCTALDDSGRFCSFRPCGPGLYCSYRSEGNACLPATLVIGAVCGIVDGKFVEGDCAPGSICADTTCVALPSEGQACIHDRCAEGLVCVARTLACPEERIERRCMKP